MPPRPRSPKKHLLAVVILGLMAGGLLLVAGGRVRGLLVESATLAALTAAIATPIGATLALLLTKTDLPLRHVFWIALGGLILAPLYLHAAAWQAGFGALGWATQAAAGNGPIDPLLEGLPGAVWVHAMAAVPWVALIVGGVLTGVSRDHEESAALETTPASVLAWITLRRAAAGAALAALWVGVVCASEMTVTDLFNVRTFAEEVYTQATLGMFDRNTTESSPLGVLGLLSGVMLLLLVSTILIAGGVPLTAEPNDHESDHRWRWRLGAGKSVAFMVAALLLLLVAGLPAGNLAYKAGINVEETPEGWQRSWSATKLVQMVAAAPWEHRRELSLSLQLGVCVATAATLGGGASAWWLCQSKRGRRRLLVLLAAGLVVPGPLLGVAAIAVLNQPPDSPLAFLTWFYDRTMLAPWLVQMVRITPLATLVLWPALASIPRDVIDAATSEGVGRWTALFRIALPMRLPAVAAAWIVSFAGSVGELAATVLVLPPGPQTVTLRIFSLLHYGVEDRVAALSLLMLGAYLLLGGAATWLLLGSRGDARSVDFPR